MSLILPSPAFSDVKRPPRPEDDKNVFIGDEPVYDPRLAITQAIDVMKIDPPRPALNYVLLAQYVPPDFDYKRAGTAADGRPMWRKMFRAEQTQRNAIYDGLVGLVLDKGPDCYTYPEGDPGRGRAPEIGEWWMFAFYQTQDSRFRMGGLASGLVMAMVKDSDLRARISDPAAVL